MPSPQKNLDPDSEVRLSKLLQAEKTAPTLYEIGTLYYEAGRNDLAIKSLLEAIQLDSDHDESFAKIAQITAAENQKQTALVYATLAVQTRPGNAGHMELFVDIIKTQTLGNFHPDIKDIMCKCLSHQPLNHQHLCAAWHDLLRLDPDTRLVWALIGQKNYKKFRKKFVRIIDRQNIQDPLFLLGLRRLILPSLALEKFIFYLRKALWEIPGRSKKPVFNTPPLALASALAEYCFYTEYILDTDDRESQLLEDIRNRLESGTDYPDESYELALMACYQPLQILKNAEELLKKYESDEYLGPLLKAQIEEPFKERGSVWTIR